MKITVPIVVILVLCGCSGKGNLQSERAPTNLSKWSWLPPSDTHDPDLDKVPLGAEVRFYVPAEAPLTTHCVACKIDTNLNAVPTVKGSLVVDGGALVSQLGSISVTARWGDWDIVWADHARTARVGWGYCLTSGNIILPREVFENPPPDRFVQNAFQIEPFGLGNVLIGLDPAKGNRLCFLGNPPTAGSMGSPTAGWIGSKAEVNGRVLERKADGWYSGATRMSN